MRTMAKTSGYRRYSAEFNREQVERAMRGEITAAELSRELGVARSLIQRLKYLLLKDGQKAVASDDDVVPASELRAAQQRIRDRVLEQLALWVHDYNHFAPHSSLGMRSPIKYRHALDSAAD
jgi:transposase InsO family protein